MTQEFAIYILRETLFTALMLAAPMLLTGLGIGVMISLLQSMTQLQEMTLTFIPKIVGVSIVMILFLPWSINTMIRFTNMIYGFVSQMAY